MECSYLLEVVMKTGTDNHWGGQLRRELTRPLPTLIQRSNLLTKQNPAQKLEFCGKWLAFMNAIDRVTYLVDSVLRTQTEERENGRVGQFLDPTRGQ